MRGLRVYDTDKATNESNNRDLISYTMDLPATNFGKIWPNFAKFSKIIALLRFTLASLVNFDWFLS